MRQPGVWCPECSRRKPGWWVQLIVDGCSTILNQDVKPARLLCGTWGCDHELDRIGGVKMCPL